MWQCCWASKLAALLLLCSLIDTVHAQRTWVYTMVSADHGGDLLLPHFVNHYHQLGITYRRFVILVHHTPARHPRAALEKITGICQGYSLECRLWEGEYTPDGHYERHLRILNELIQDPYDWIIIADSDELQEWPGLIRDELDTLTQAGRDLKMTFSHIEGVYVDRVGIDGRVAPILPVSQQGPSSTLFRQFPIKCSPLHVEDAIITKVVAVRNFLRLSRGWSRAVTPNRAAAYFGACSKGQRCMRGTLEGTAQDLFNLTPYSTDPSRYRYSYTPEDAKGVAGAGMFQHTVWNGTLIPIHHFRWHNGSIGELQDYVERYRGDCDMDKTLSSSSGGFQEDCAPLVPRWREAAEELRAVLATGKVDVTGAKCVKVAADHDVATDTSYMGLAWEQYDAALNVSSKVRNTVKGDSQTRMASLAAGAESDGGGSGDDGAGATTT